MSEGERIFSVISRAARPRDAVRELSKQELALLWLHLLPLADGNPEGWPAELAAIVMGDAAMRFFEEV